MPNSAQKQDVHPTPYGSFFLASVSKTPKTNILDDLVWESKKLLKIRIEENDGRVQNQTNIPAKKYGKLHVIGFQFIETSVCRWQNSLRDKNNVLLLICRWKTYIAIYCSNSNHRKMITSTIGKIGADKNYPTLFSLKKIPSGILTAAFLDNQPLKAMWLAGTHRSVNVKPDSKVISGKNLIYALDPLGDTTYIAAAVRSSTAGVSLKGSGLWTKPYGSMNEFSKGVIDALKLIDANTGNTSILPVLANELHSFTGVGKAFDFEVAPLEVLHSCTDRSKAHNLTESVDFSILNLPSTATALGAFHLQLKTKGTTTVTQIASVVVAPSFSTTSPSDLVFDVSMPMGQVNNPILQSAIADLVESPAIFRVFYETGHTISVGHLAISQPKDRDFQNWKWIDFQALRAIDVSKEKPTNNILENIWKNPNDDSLFSWFVETVSNTERAQTLGLTELNQNQNVWVFCDDDSGEVADFVHVHFPINSPTEICLIHIKGARSNSANREMVAGPFEVVCGQAMKNIHFIDAEKLANRIAGHVNDLKRPLWNAPNVIGNAPNGNRTNFNDALRGVGANAKYRILIVQPHVTKAAYSLPNNQVFALNAYRGGVQLRSLLFGTQNAASSVGAEFHVTGSD